LVDQSPEREAISVVLEVVMARTKIDWADETWNPVWGCTFRCPFCYARKIAKRFSKQIALLNGVNEEKLREFKPVFLPKNYGRELKGKIIFVNSMSDIADWELAWIEKTMLRIRTMPDKVFLFLTKRPEQLERILQIVQHPLDPLFQWKILRCKP